MNSTGPIQSAKDALQLRMARLRVRDADFVESFARSSGPGGQNVNKVSTAVTLRHLPSGLSVTAQDSRSQSVNRSLARERLLDLIEKRQSERKQAAISVREKARRQKSPRPRGLKNRILEAKNRRGQIKKQRAKVAE